MKVDNAIIMAAGTSSRFAPLSYEKPKSLIEVKGEILIERQIMQLKEAGIPEIYIVTGYKADQFVYLKEKYGVKLIHNPNYLTRNNNGSIWCVRNILHNSYICSSDNYFMMNPFESDVAECYYAAEFSEAHTAEWCMTEDEYGFIDSVTIGGENAWYMIGHAYFNKAFSDPFVRILEKEYEASETRQGYWEDVYIRHISELPMKINRYANGDIFEFDTLDELRKFDDSYVSDTRSAIIKDICSEHGWAENDLKEFRKVKFEGNALQFRFKVGNTHYLYDNLSDKKLRII